MSSLIFQLCMCSIMVVFGVSLCNAAEPPKVSVKVVPDGESITRPDFCRGTLVGPGINQPDPFPGYTGFVGWESPALLHSGELLVGFNAGYWHFSPPTPYTAKSEADGYIAGGMPTNIDAPRGGRAMLIRSGDAGRTWSKPLTIADTPWDDRHPSLLELPSGVILCSFFKGTFGDYKTNKDVGFRSMVTRSHDGGYTWEEARPIPSPFLADETDGPMVLAKDGSVYMVIDGDTATEGWQIGVFRSTDEGNTWQLLSTVKADHDLYEPSIAELPDGKMVIVARAEGDLFWSSDKGKTWTKPAKIGMRLFAPSLIVLKDGTLFCLHGSYGAGGLRATFSRDGGRTWIAPAADHGFLVDNSYGYGKGVQLSDGSIFITYLSSGGHTGQAAATNSVWSIRMRIRSDFSGIDLLPAPNKKQLMVSYRTCIGKLYAKGHMFHISHLI